MIFLYAVYRRPGRSRLRRTGIPSASLPKPPTPGHKRRQNMHGRERYGKGMA